MERAQHLYMQAIRGSDSPLKDVEPVGHRQLVSLYRFATPTVRFTSMLESLVLFEILAPDKAKQTESGGVGCVCVLNYKMLGLFEGDSAKKENSFFWVLIQLKKI